MTDRRCYTPEEYAESRRISVRTVYRHIRAGTIKGVERVGRQYRIWTRVPNSHDTGRQDTPNPSTPIA